VRLRRHALPCTEEFPNFRAGGCARTQLQPVTNHGFPKEHNGSQLPPGEFLGSTSGDGEWNIDHVLVGPGGVFVLETKARPRRKATRDQEEHDVFFDGRTLQFPWCQDDRAVEQVERNARWIREFLAFSPREHPSLGSDRRARLVCETTRQLFSEGMNAA